MRSWPANVTVALVFLLRLALPVFATSESTEQVVVPVAPQGEQRVQPVAPAGEQHVEVLGSDGTQQIGSAAKSPVRRTVDGVTKVAVGVMAVGVSIGVMVASLLLL